MRDDADRLMTSNKNLTDRFTAVQEDATKLHREKNALANEVSQLKQRLAIAEKAAEDARYSGRRDDSSSSLSMRQLEVFDKIIITLSINMNILARTRGSKRRSKQEGSGHSSV